METRQRTPGRSSRTAYSRSRRAGRMPTDSSPSTRRRWCSPTPPRPPTTSWRRRRTAIGRRSSRKVTTSRSRSPACSRAAPHKKLAREFLRFMVSPGLPGHHSDDQLDAAGSEDGQAAPRRLRQARQARPHLPVFAGEGRRQSQGLDRRVARGDEQIVGHRLHGNAQPERTQAHARRRLCGTWRHGGARSRGGRPAGGGDGRSRGGPLQGLRCLCLAGHPVHARPGGPVDAAVGRSGGPARQRPCAPPALLRPAVADPPAGIAARPAPDRRRPRHHRGLGPPGTAQQTC